MPQDEANDNVNGDLSLPTEMFREGESKPEPIVISQVVKRFHSKKPVNFNGFFTEIDGLAIYEGDIVLGKADDIRTAPESKGIGIVGENFRWENGVVPYIIACESLTPRVNMAVNHWQTKTPIKFVARTTEPDYISFECQVGCWSMVGRRGGKQVISLGTGCNVGSAIHEIGHALGLWHEQSRSDRDQYIEIIKENIKPNRESNFEKHLQDGKDWGNYDYDSIMHYPANAFGINGATTIRVRATGQPIGQRDGLSSGDVNAIYNMYRDIGWESVAGFVPPET